MASGQGEDDNGDHEDEQISMALTITNRIDDLPEKMLGTRTSCPRILPRFEQVLDEFLAVSLSTDQANILGDFRPVLRLCTTSRVGAA